jgi:ribonuclease P protein component
MKKSLTKKERLKRKKDIRRIFEEGKRQSCFGAKLIYNENNLAYIRFAVCLARNFKNAVLRNKTKRICREVFRSMKPVVRNGYDIVFLAYPENCEWASRSGQFRYLLGKAGLFKSQSHA